MRCKISAAETQRLVANRRLRPCVWSRYRSLLQQREELSDYFRDRLREVAAAHGERLLETPTNRISFGMSLDCFNGDPADSKLNETYLGSMLFTRNISGTRVIKKLSDAKTICDVSALLRKKRSKKIIEELPYEMAYKL